MKRGSSFQPPKNQNNEPTSHSLPLSISHGKKHEHQMRLSHKFRKSRLPSKNPKWLRWHAFGGQQKRTHTLFIKHLSVFVIIIMGKSALQPKSMTNLFCSTSKTCSLIFIRCGCPFFLTKIARIKHFSCANVFSVCKFLSNFDIFSRIILCVCPFFFPNSLSVSLRLPWALGIEFECHIRLRGFGFILR